MLCQVVCDDAVLKTRSAALSGSRLPSIAACDSKYIVRQICRLRHGSPRARLSKKQFLNI
jgi:hypothetical protein